MLTIDKVIYNPPATIILWNDGTKTMSKCDEEDTYNKATGFMLCVLKKKYGNKTVRQMFNRYVYNIPKAKTNGVVVVQPSEKKFRKPNVHKAKVKVKRPTYKLEWVDDDEVNVEVDVFDSFNDLFDEIYKLFSVD